MLLITKDSVVRGLKNSHIEASINLHIISNTEYLTVFFSCYTAEHVARNHKKAWKEVRLTSNQTLMTKELMKEI